MATPDSTPAASPVKRLWRSIVKLARENTRLVVALMAAVVFIYLLGEVGEGEILKLDTLAYRLFVEKLRSDSVTAVMEGFTGLLEIPVLLLMTLLITAFAPGRAPGRCVAVNLVGALVLNVVLKEIVQRPRPDGFRLISETGYSFPSGHSMISMAFFGLIVWMIWTYERDRRLRNFLCVAFSLVIVMVGVSRIYLGVHYASDVLAGFCVSVIWLAFYTHVIAPAFLAEAKREVQELREASDADENAGREGDAPGAAAPSAATH
ncbi:phosphatase PAP2 family protein [Paratractidigestivibacter sp.]|uniref:phosphatase PAP2 family protein n=1 Tax=Paratractidigestivibacter sp. TaxID=2847316 RepID=UPI002ACB08CB|nr:phosphatase PAP2 family protein [Paratractidigestivibacter sp.]